MARIIALLSDFGTVDPYLGAMKGAILSVCPEATLVDLVHDLPAHDVLAGALALDAAHSAFPAGTVFVAVVDPGVGSARRGLAIRAGAHVFVGPDNGLFTFVLRAHPEAHVHAIVNAALGRAPRAPVFHGRDVFGPVAAQLAGGLAIEEVGPKVGDAMILDVPSPRRLEEGGFEAVVVHVDRFGNLTTNLPGRACEGAGIQVWVGSVLVPFVSIYADVPRGAPCALLGSSGRLEVAVREGSAAVTLGAGKGTAVRVVVNSPTVSPDDAAGCR
jgi:S-adenosyl-L-methionine hydrolase (adenosine-forming)